VAFVHAGAGDHQRAYVGHLCVIRHPSRGRVQEELQRRGVATAVHFPIPDPRQPAIAGQAHRAGDLATTEALCAEVLSLPCFPELTEPELAHVVDALDRVV
jgi:dTDP-4-amino-4,6-dideoxygalactose transaminase